MVLVFSYLTASAQIATPLLDRTMKVQSPAAAGWRDGSTVGINGITAEGKVNLDDDEIGDVTVGGSIPAIIAAYKGEVLAIELYVSTDTTRKMDLEYQKNETIYKPPVIATPTSVPFNAKTELEEKLPETRLNLSYVFGEALSVGLGYRVNQKKQESTTNAVSVTGALPASLTLDIESKSTETVTGLMVSASLKLADMFYIAGGMENVSVKKTEDEDITSEVVGVLPASTESDNRDYEDNAWTNTIIGVGLLVGDPGESRFRAEYSVINSPESKEGDADDLLAGFTAEKRQHLHPKTEFSTMSVEALFSDFMLSYSVESKKETDANSMLLGTADAKLVTTQMGLGWMPEEGIAVSAYSWKMEQTETSTNAELKADPTGWRINVAWNF